MCGRFIRLLISAVVLLVAGQAYGQHRLSAGLRGGYPFSPQNELLEGVNSLERPLRIAGSADVQYAFIIPGTSYQGVGLSVFSLFDHEDVGTPLSLYIFQGARIVRLSSVLSLDYEWNFGASFGWHRNEEHPLNTIMGTKVNAYINGGIMLTWQDDDLTVSIGPEFTHYSNGQTELPNAGLNVVGLRLNAARTFEGNAFPRITEALSKEKRTTGKISWDITAFGSLKKCAVSHNGINYKVEGRFATAGIHINPFYDLHKHFRAGASLDLNYDESANISSHVAGTASSAIGFFRPSLEEQVSLGLSVRAELVMPIFSVQFGIGHNIIYKGPDLAGLYQIIALKTHVTKRLYLHTGYQFRDFHRPDHLLLGLGYRFGK